MNSIKSLKVLLFVFIFFSYSLPAQSNNSAIDPLINETTQLYMDGKTSGLISSSRKIIKISDSLKYEKGLSLGYYYLATYYYDNAKFRESLKYAKKANSYTRYLGRDQTHSAKISSLLGSNYLLLEMYTLASKNYRDALHILKSKSKENITDSLTEGMIYSNLSYLYENIGLNDSMYYYLKKEKAILKKIHYKDAFIEKGCSCLGFGNYYLSQNKTDSARYYYQKSLEFFKNKKHPCKIESLIGLGNLYTREKKYKKAHNFYDNAEDGFENGNFPDIQCGLYKSIYELYIAEGNAAEGKRYQDLYSEAYKELNDRIKKERDTVMSEVMNQERISSEAEVQQGKKYIILMVSLLVFITLLIIYLLKRATDKNDKTSEMTKQLRAEKLLQEKEKNMLKLQLKATHEEIITLAKENSHEFFARFQQGYPLFCNKMLKINPSFKTSELTFAAYIYLGFNTKEIADYTFKAVKTIENNRYNFRKKLEISPEKDLHIWLRNYIDSE